MYGLVDNPWAGTTPWDDAADYETFKVYIDTVERDHNGKIRYGEAMVEECQTLDDALEVATYQLENFPQVSEAWVKHIMEWKNGREESKVVATYFFNEDTQRVEEA